MPKFYKNPQPQLIPYEKWNSYTDEKKFEIIVKARENEKKLREQKDKHYSGTYIPDIKPRGYSISAKKRLNLLNF